MSVDAPQPASSESPVLSRREGAITRITLNRPRAINALSREMLALLAAAIETAAGDGSTAILLDGAGERGFCGGGDIKELSGGDPRSFLASEYRVDHAIAVSPVPVIGIMDGVTMGGGIGLAGHAAHRVVTERSRLAMPEARIGIAPDVGGHLLLARGPGRLGELLAVTAGEMTGADAIALGFADAFVPSERLGELGEALAAGEDPAAAIASVADPAPESSLLAAREWFDPIAEGALGGPEAPASAPAPVSAFADPAGAALRLVVAMEQSDSVSARNVARTVRGMCPTSVAVTLAQLDRTRTLHLDLSQVLDDDLRVLVRLCSRPDFAEGVRAQLVDKDRDPRWSPARIEDLEPAELAEILAV